MPEQMAGEECPFCYDPLGQQRCFRANCNHIFHWYGLLTKELRCRLVPHEEVELPYVQSTDLISDMYFTYKD